MIIEDIFAEGDKVWARFKGKGTHKGEYRGLAPTGKKIKPNGVVIYRIVNGKIVEAWEIPNLLDIYEPLGVIEYKEFPKDVS